MAKEEKFDFTVLFVIGSLQDTGLKPPHSEKRDQCSSFVSDVIGGDTAAGGVDGATIVDEGEDILKVWFVGEYAGQ